MYPVFKDNGAFFMLLGEWQDRSLILTYLEDAKRNLDAAEPCVPLWMLALAMWLWLSVRVCVAVCGCVVTDASVSLNRETLQPRSTTTPACEPPAARSRQ